MQSDKTAGVDSAKMTTPSRLVSGLILALFFLGLGFYGVLISAIVLRQADICFLLATGRWICTHHMLPLTDPFSWTVAYNPMPYVIEKWLSEVVFFVLESHFGAFGLELFSALLSVAAFVVIPYRIASLLKISRWAALVLTITCASVSLCHLFARPELFSYLFTAVWLELLIALSLKHEIKKQALFIFFVTSVLWANMHTTFFVGMGLIAAYIFSSLLASKISTGKFSIEWTAAISLVVSLLASLINPYGIGIWLNLLPSFSESGGNFTNHELQPLYDHVLQESSGFIFYSFILQCLCSFLLLLRGGIKFPVTTGAIFIRITLITSIIGGIKSVRAIPLAGLIIAISSMYLLFEKPLKLSVALETIEQCLRKTIVLGQNQFSVIATCVVVFSCYLTALAIPPELPPPHPMLTPPVEGIKFLEKSTPRGRLLNEMAFGSYIMWRMNPNPPIFVDPRLNLYGLKLINDYNTLAFCKPGWKTLLDTYKIDWIFMPLDMPIVYQLSQSTQWKILHKDALSIVIARNQD